MRNNETTEKPRGIAILGSTGNIGVQTLDIISQNQNLLSVKLLTAHSNLTLLITQSKIYKPRFVYISDKSKTNTLKRSLAGQEIIVLENLKELYQSFYIDDLDLVLLAIVGFAGLEPALEVVKAKKTLALANKESLVAGGELLMQEAKKNKVNIIPVDSEHSAIFQCLIGETLASVEKIILTASGGPFRDYSQQELKNVKPQDALKHPKWDMGPKVSVDSASMMNKGLEMIEAKYLFGLTPEQIEIVIHPQAIVHSMVQFTDGSIKAQMGLPDMRNPIHYALFYPKRMQSSLKRLDFTAHYELSFKPVNLKKFRNLALAFEALKIGGNMPAILNAANEVAVEAFLHNKLSFTGIPDIIEGVMAQAQYIKMPSLSDLQQIHAESVLKTKELIKAINN